MEIKKALTFRASSIGDCLMGKYFLENIRAAHPSARCGLVVASRGAMLRDLLAAYPWIEVIEANRRSPRALLHLLRRFWHSDIVCTEYTNGTVGLATKLMARLLARRGGLIGFADKSRLSRYVYDALLPLPPTGTRSQRLYEHDALAAAHIPVGVEKITFTYVPARGLLERQGLKKNRYVVVHFFAGIKERSLSRARGRVLLAELSKKLPGMRFVISGGPADRAEALAAAEGFAATVVAGSVSLQETAQLIAESRGVVSADTGVAHLSAQLGKRPIVLATCLGPNWWFKEQYGEGAATFFNRADLCTRGHVIKNYPDCLNEIDMQKVAQALAAQS